MRIQTSPNGIIFFCYGFVKNRKMMEDAAALSIIVPRDYALLKMYSRSASPLALCARIPHQGRIKSPIDYRIIKWIR